MRMIFYHAFIMLLPSSVMQKKIQYAKANLVLTILILNLHANATSH